MSTYLRIIRRGWILLVAFALAGATIAAVAWAITPRTYAATSEVFVSTDTAKTVDELNEGAALTQQVVKSYVEVVDTPYVLRPVITQLGLRTDTDDLAKQVTAEAPLDTVVIKITVTDRSPARAARIADAIVERLRGAVTNLSPNPTSAAAAIKLTPLRPTTAPGLPTGPSLLVAILLGLAAGILLGLILGYVRDRTDVVVRSPEDVERTTGDALLASTSFALRRGRADAHQIDPADARALRSAAVRLELLELPRDRRSIVVTSAVDGEGKTTTAITLAVLLAEAGRRVLLVDGDLGRPGVAGALGIGSGAGLAEVLRGGTELGEAVRSQGRHRPDVLTAGDIGPDSGELVRSWALQRLLVNASVEYDLVLIDGPSLLTSSDAAILTERSGGALLIAAANRVTRPQVHAAVAILDRVGTPRVGVLATMVRKRRTEAATARQRSSARAVRVPDLTAAARPDAAAH